jgi:glycosyltransferase involved in cell wall biosynthesis
MAREQLFSPRINKRILVLTSTFPRRVNDTEPRFVFDLCSYYVNHGFVVDVIAPHANGSKRYEVMDGVNVYRYRYFPERLQTLAYEGGIIPNLKKNRLNYLLVPFFILFQSLAIIRCLKGAKYHLIHAHWLVPQAFICAVVLRYIVRAHIPILCTSHGADLYALNGAMMRRIKRWTGANCAHLCVVSKAMKRDILNLGLPADSVSIIPMGVELRNTFTQKADVTRRANRIIFVGRFVAKKGIEILIDALTLIRDAYPRIELLLVGDGPLRQQLEERVNMAGASGNVKFTGGVAHDVLPELYSSASIAVVPSIIDAQGDREGLGLVMIEAMGCGCAVVASAMEPLTEVVEHEKSGLIFEPGNAEDLSRQLVRLLRDPEFTKNLARRGGEIARESYDWGRISEYYTRLIEKISVT